MRVVLLVALLLLLPGCAQPEGPPAPVVTLRPPPPPTYPLTIRLVAGTADGPPLPDAEVYLVPEGEASPDPTKLPPPRFADAQGEVRVRYAEPVTLLVQAFGPGRQGGGWTREGMVVQVGANVTADRGLRVEDRTVTLPLLRAQVPFGLDAAWGPAQAGVSANGSIHPAQARFEVPLPPALLGRIAQARVELAWTQGPEAFGDLHVGLARGGPVLAGPDRVDLPAPGAEAQESVEGALQGDGPLEVVALTRSAVHGTLSLRFAGTLHVAGSWPSALPLPECFGAAACSRLPAPTLPGS